MARFTPVFTNGLIEDDTDYAIGQAGYTDINNMRPHRKSMEIIGGWESATLDKISGICRGVHSWVGTSGDIITAFGTHTGLYVLADGVLTDITPVSGFTAGEQHGLGGSGYGTGAYGIGAYGEPSTSDFFPLTWSLDNYGSKLIANPRGQTIFEWGEGDPNAAAITNAPAKVTCILSTDERQIVAYGCNEETSGTFNSRCIRYSDIEDITDWTTTATNNAGEYILESQGRLVAARHVGDSVMLWTSGGAYSQTFLGNPSQTYDFRPMGENNGLAGANAVGIYSSAAYWVAPDYTFWTAGLGGLPQRLRAPLQSNFADNLALVQDDKIFGASVSEFGEIWWFYQSRDGEDCDNYIAYSTAENKWFKGDIRRTAYLDATPSPFTMATAVDGSIYWHEKGHSADGGAISWHSETGYLTMPNAENLIRVKGLWPDFKDQIGAVNLTLTTKLFPQGDETVFGSYVITPGQDKLDFLVNARLIKMKFSGSSTPARCRFGKLNIDIKSGSKR